MAAQGCATRAARSTSTSGMMEAQARSTPRVERCWTRTPSRGGTAMSERTILEDRVIPADGHWGRVLRQGQMLRIIDLEGKQAVDFLCYNATDPSERYNAAD